MMITLSLILSTLIFEQPGLQEPLILKQVAAHQTLFRPDNLVEHAAQWGIACPVEDLVLVGQQESLRGTHFRFQQQFAGVSVFQAELIVSVNSRGEVFRIYNRTVTPPSAVPSYKNRLSEDDAYEVAWNKLGVFDGLNDQPSAPLLWLAKQGAWQLIYQVILPVDGPHGTWQVRVDALNGSLVEPPVDTRIYRKTKTRTESQGHELLDRQTEFQRFFAQVDRTKAKSYKKANGTGLVFDPDPVTTLMTHLEDNSPAVTFDPAYFTRALLDITQSGGSFQLVGPYCSIINFDRPNTAPSTTTDGNWSAKRGNNAFNDANTYFHIDQNQRYMRTLGFSGNKGIQDGSIEVDTDGEQGADNSAFIPSSNRLTFGHGCVDDNEDADVILHEYGHSIQYSINNNWDGGDTGAMGEGFGDYWAGSYSYKTPNGPFYNPAWMFTWDGHNNCWDGRVMDAQSLQYDSSRTYGAHGPMPGTPYQTDELWSTPLFQAMIELNDRGIPIWQVDQIILEAHFGFGSGIKMPVMAQAIVDAAADLFPNGPHADVLQASFARHNILNAKDKFVYIASHIPPAGNNAGDWASEIQLSNPNTSEATVTYEVFELSGSQFTLTSSGSLSLAAGRTQIFVPGGSAQRWARFSSNKPIGGSTLFSRTPGAGTGEEKASIPLTDDYFLGSTQIFPHVPADRATFWSGGVIVNPGDQALTVTFTLIGDKGNDLSNLLGPNATLQLSAHQKWVSLFAGTLFDDSGSAEKVAYIKASAASEMAAFQLYGFQGSSVATSGITASPDRSVDFWTTRLNLTQTAWTGISVLNPTDSVAELNLTLVDSAGGTLQTGTLSLPARTKILGLNLASGFTFPYQSSLPTVFSTSSPAAAMIIESAAPLRVFELAGDGANSTLDGAASLHTKSNVVLSQPKGILEIVNGKIGQTVLIKPRDANGNIMAGQQTTLNADPFQTISMDVSGWGASSIQVTGKQLVVFGIENDTQKGSLTIAAPGQLSGLVPQ
ncbi:MAG: hypothetical protein KDC71_07585 [Acidobacteria bacterium]|nr:hypothetical protein [Acidobacteriota bacterium]